MDEAEKYQQRLQAIAERRRQQEEEERLRRQTEEEWLQLAQKKRKSLRDQWLSQAAPAPAFPSLDSLRPHPLPQDRTNKHTAEEQSKSQKTPEEEVGEAADVRKEEDRVSKEENKESVNGTTPASAHNHHQPQAGTEEKVQVSRAAEGHFSAQMTQKMFHESRQDGRSVLGMVAVQVERDPKTGATVIRSVAPMSAPDGAAMATVFDDGRKSVHAVGGSGGQPSAEELGQILSVVDGVGMHVLLDEVTVTPNKGKIKIENVEGSRTLQEKEGKVLSYSTHHAVSPEKTKPLESTGGNKPKAELEIEGCNESGREEDEQEEESVVVVKEAAGKVGNMEDQAVEYKMEEGPVTLTFLGYTDATSGQGQSQSLSVGQEDHGGFLTVERVIITDEGEEQVLGPVTSASSQSQSSSEGLKDPAVSGGDKNADLGGGAQKPTKEEAFQDIPLDGNGEGVTLQGKDADHNSVSPSRSEGEGTPKRKTCQCCSVM
ncbi:paralemmin-2-like [Myripristis murdjan]|uniref:paralemmin-2-like n=1 Tax=Myripristis murdjan TaxID=586833 RepID=UPI001175E82B|nr:paralemmin-2-like [Myripristis murdjan]